MLVGLLLLSLAPQQPDTATLHGELARLIDLPSARGRALAAEQLANKNIATLEQWLAACATFGDFAPLEAGSSRHQVDLRVLDAVESTEIHLYVPPGYDPDKPAPLLLWGHGAGGTGARQDLMWQQTADRLGMFVLAPTEFGKVAGWGSTPRERHAQLAALRWARRFANIDENAIFVGGASRGGHMAWDLALRFPDLWAGMLPCIGGPRLQIGAANNLRYLENVAGLPIRDLQGSQDDPLLLDNLHLAFDQLRKWKAKDAVLHEFPDRGHDFDLAAVDWQAFFAHRRDPQRSEVVRLAADLDEARAGWAVITGVERDIVVDAVPRVSTAQWDKLDEAGRRALTHKRIVEQTARLEVSDRGKGRFTARGDGVTAFELLLNEDQLGRDGKLEIRWQNRPVRKTAAPSVAVLLGEFAERFDRTFLPVARVAVP